MHFLSVIYGTANYQAFDRGAPGLMVMHNIAIIVQTGHFMSPDIVCLFTSEYVIIRYFILINHDVFYNGRSCLLNFLIDYCTDHNYHIAHWIFLYHVD